MMDKATVDSLATRAEGFVASGAVPSPHVVMPTSNGAAAAPGKATERQSLMEAKLQVGQSTLSSAYSLGWLMGFVVDSG